MTSREEVVLAEALDRSNGLLEKDFAAGQWWALRCAQDKGITVHYGSRQRPYRVMWKTCGDYRKRNGEIASRTFCRTRSFGKIDSVLKFIQEF
jgi:hypothetical protein